ncbi:MAG: hypothetical protein IPK13_04695 [Deltaproteobacteria bacterium]|nr:hypothetical protein [Deltaproteobacteria bacterium]
MAALGSPRAVAERRPRKLLERKEHAAIQAFVRSFRQDISRHERGGGPHFDDQAFLLQLGAAIGRRLSANPSVFLADLLADPRKLGALVRSELLADLGREEAQSLIPILLSGIEGGKAGYARDLERGYQSAYGYHWAQNTSFRDPACLLRNQSGPNSLVDAAGLMAAHMLERGGLRPVMLCLKEASRDDREAWKNESIVGRLAGSGRSMLTMSMREIRDKHLSPTAERGMVWDFEALTLFFAWCAAVHLASSGPQPPGYEEGERFAQLVSRLAALHGISFEHWARVVNATLQDPETRDRLLNASKTSFNAALRELKAEGRVPLFRRDHECEPRAPDSADEILEDNAASIEALCSERALRVTKEEREELRRWFSMLPNAQTSQTSQTSQDLGRRSQATEHKSALRPHNLRAQIDRSKPENLLRTLLDLVGEGELHDFPLRARRLLRPRQERCLASGDAFQSAELRRLEMLETICALVPRHWRRIDLLSEIVRKRMADFGRDDSAGAFWQRLRLRNFLAEQDLGYVVDAYPIAEAGSWTHRSEMERVLRPEAGDQDLDLPSLEPFASASDYLLAARRDLNGRTDSPESKEVQAPSASAPEELEAAFLAARKMLGQYSPEEVRRVLEPKFPNMTKKWLADMLQKHPALSNNGGEEPHLIPAILCAHEMLGSSPGTTYEDIVERLNARPEFAALWPECPGFTTTDLECLQRMYDLVPRWPEGTKTEADPGRTNTGNLPTILDKLGRLTPTAKLYDQASPIGQEPAFENAVVVGNFIPLFDVIPLFDAMIKRGAKGPDIVACWLDSPSGELVRSIAHRTLGIQGVASASPEELASNTEDALVQGFERAKREGKNLVVHLIGVNLWHKVEALASSPEFADVTVLAVSHTTSDANELRAASEEPASEKQPSARRPVTKQLPPNVFLTVMADSPSKIEFEAKEFVPSFLAMLGQIRSRIDKPINTGDFWVVGAAGAIVGKAATSASSAFSGGNVYVTDPQFDALTEQQKYEKFGPSGPQVLKSNDAAEHLDRRRRPVVLLNCAGCPVLTRDFLLSGSSPVFVGNLGIGIQDKAVLDALIEETDETGQKRGTATRVFDLEDPGGWDALADPSGASPELMTTLRYDIRVGRGDEKRTVYLLAGGRILNFISPIPNPQGTSHLHGLHVVLAVAQCRAMAKARVKDRTRLLECLDIVHHEGRPTVIVCPPGTKLTDYPGYHPGLGRALPSSKTGDIDVIDVSNIECVDVVPKGAPAP